MDYQPQIKKRNGKDYILCVWRHKFVRLTPEEWVRQHVLHGLVESYHYPKEMIAVEAPIEVNGLKKRCDAIIYNKELRPLCIVEFKAPHIQLSQEVFDQVAIYNQRVNVNYFILSNGREHKACRVSATGYEHLKGLPFYEELWQNN